MRVFLTAILVFLMAVPAMAGSKTTQQCGNEFDQCRVACNASHRDEPSHAPCAARCSGLYAACEAGVAYDKAKPWVDEQEKKTKKFFDELMKMFDEKDAPSPEAKTKLNSI